MFQPLGGVAVIADNTWAAFKGRKALKIEWNDGANASFESAAYKQQLIATVRQPQKVVRNLGNVDAEFAKGGKVIEATYYDADAGARGDGAAGGGGGVQERQGRGLDVRRRIRRRRRIRWRRRSASTRRTSPAT